MAERPRHCEPGVGGRVLKAPAGFSVSGSLELDSLHPPVVGDREHRRKRPRPAVIAPAVRAHRADVVHVDALGGRRRSECKPQVRITTLLEHIPGIIAGLDQRRSAAQSLGRGRWKLCESRTAERQRQLDRGSHMPLRSRTGGKNSTATACGQGVLQTRHRERCAAIEGSQADARVGCV